VITLEKVGIDQNKLEEQLVANYRSELVGIMTKITKNKSLAEDISHDALLTVIRRLRTTGIEKPSSLKSYLKKTAYYLYLGSLRKRSNNTVPEENIDRYHCDQLFPEEQLGQARLAETMQLLIQELPIERDKQILRRKYIDEEAKGLICESLDLSLTHFDRVIARARRRLRGIAMDREISTAIL